MTVTVRFTVKLISNFVRKSLSSITMPANASSKLRIRTEQHASNEGGTWDNVVTPE